MRCYILALLMLTSLFSVGCITSSISDDQDNTNENFEDFPLNVIFPTLGRDVDITTNYNLLDQANNRSTLILWAGAGCSGCHDWTQMLRGELENGNISNDSHIVTIHRYPKFESTTQIYNVYGNESSNEYAPWPILMPQDGAFVWNAETGDLTDVKLTDAFDNPVTPTLQIIDSDGFLIWQSRTYWADTNVIAEISTVLNML